MSDIDLKCKQIGDLWYELYSREEKRECEELATSWVKKHFWGLVVRDSIVIFEELHSLLSENGHDSNNKFFYGENSVWIEKVKNPDNKKVIASSSFHGDNQAFLYILDNTSYRDMLKFKCRTVWRRENNKGGYKVAKSKKCPDGWFSWGDDRDIEVPSINTYRKRDFDFSYGDCRDKGHVFTYEQLINPTLDNPHWHESKISHSLTTLKRHIEEFKRINNELR